MRWISALVAFSLVACSPESTFDPQLEYACDAAGRLADAAASGTLATGNHEPEATRRFSEETAANLSATLELLRSAADGGGSDANATDLRAAARRVDNALRYWRTGDKREAVRQIELGRAPLSAVLHRSEYDCSNPINVL